MPIHIKDLKFVYLPGTPFEHVALENISLDIEDGEFVGIIGHTGSGKTTLVQLICGLIKPDRGGVEIDGMDIFDKKLDKKRLRSTVGMVFQYPEYQLFEETVEKDVAFGPAKLGLGREEVEERVQEALDLVGMDSALYGNKSPFELSGGQKRKVAIAGVLAMRPKILIMDEPIAGLDPIGRENLMALVKRLNDSGTTILMISHNMDGLAEYASKIIAMKSGRVFLEGTPKEVFSQYDKLEEAGLGLPETVQLVRRLREKGREIPKDIIKYDELESFLLHSLKGRTT